MRSIKELTAYGVGRRCIIVGGGHSAAMFHDAYLEGFVISCNTHAIKQADMVIFHDQEAGDKVKCHILPDIVVTHKALSERYQFVSHVYKASDTDAGGDIQFGDTGYHALQIADSIMCFDEIFLFGFDYAVQGDSYHYGEEVSDKVKLAKFCAHSIGRVAEMINRYVPRVPVYTASKSGVLKYPHLTTRLQIG